MNSQPKTDFPYTIIIPAFNEADGLPGVLQALASAAPGAEIIVVDDGSTDGTGEAARAAGGAARVISHDQNRGYGAALKTGIRASASELIVIADADGTYPLEQIPELVSMMSGGVDMAVGARTAPHASIPLARRPAKWALNRLADYLVRGKIPDLNSGLRVMRRRTLERFLNLLPDGFSFTTTITLAMLVNGCRVLYKPIDYHPRRGRSKIRPIRDTANFIQLIVRTVMYFEPLRIFGPVSACLMAASFGVFLLGWLKLDKMPDGTIVALFVAGLQMFSIGLVADLINRRLGR